MRLLLVEDDRELTRLLLELLARAGFAVDHAADGDTGMTLGEDGDYDAVVLDLGLPSVPGLEVLRQWRGRGMKLPILVLTSRGSWSERVDGLNAGADDYLGKPFQPDELVARLRALIRRSAGRAEALLRLRDITVDPLAGTVLVGGRAIEITARELSILSYLLHRQGQIVSQTQLAEHVYSSDESRDSNTIEVYIARLRKKLGREAIQTVRGLGYRMS